MADVIRTFQGHVGDAIVVFDESRVVPLFEAWEPGLCANYAPIVPPARSPIIPAVVAQLRPAVPIMPTHPARFVCECCVFLMPAVVWLVALW